MSAELVRFTFEGDGLDVVREDGEVFVALRPVCEALGVSYQGQSQKLKGDASVCLKMILMQTAGDDQRRELACLPLRSLPLWLATIHPSKVAPSVREKLIRYRVEAAEVLADHFLGPRHLAAREPWIAEPVPAPAALALSPAPPLDALAVVRELGAALREAFAPAFTSLHERLDAIQSGQLEASRRQGLVTGEQVELLKEQITELAILWVAIGWAKTPGSKRSAGTEILADLYRLITWGSGEAKIDRIPSHDYGRVLARLARLRWEARSHARRLQMSISRSPAH